MNTRVNTAWTGFGLSLLAAVALMLGAWQDMVAIWSRSETFTHCFFIAPLSLYLIWGQRTELQRLSPRIEWPALCCLFPLLLVYQLAGWVGVGVAQQFLAVLSIPLLVLGWFGRQISWHCLFPLSYLLFMVPFGEALVPHLQDITAVMSVKMVEWTGIPVYAEGHYIMLPSGHFQVAEACSGVRYLIASLAVGCLYAWLNYRLWYKRLLFVLASLLLPILANSIRAFGIMLIAHYSNFKLAVGFDHLIYGWLFFGVVILLLFWLGSLFWDDTRTPAPTTPAVPVASYPWPAALLLALALMALPSLALRFAEQGQTYDLSPLQLPNQLGDWAQVSPAQAWQSTFAGASRELFADYQPKLEPEHRTGAFVALYNQHDAEHQLIRSTHALYDWQNAILLSNQQRSTTWGQVREELVMQGEMRVLYWSWYRLGQQRAASSVDAKLRQLQARLQGQSVDLVLGLRQPIRDDQQLDSARARFEQLGAALDQQLDQQLLQLRPTP